MYNLERIENHVEIARNYLLEQYKHKPRLNSLLRILVEPLQDIENKLYEIYENTHLAKASGEYLDRIGEIVGEERLYRLDAAYKVALIERVMINNGGGTPEDIINALRFIFNPERLVYRELYPACFTVFIQARDLKEGAELAASIKPLGISDLVITGTTESDLFVLAEYRSENTFLKVKRTGGDKERKLKVITDIEESDERGQGKSPFKVTSEGSFSKFGTLGLGEIVITKTNLNIGNENLGNEDIYLAERDVYLGNEDIYLVEEDVPLDTLLAYSDFIIIGGGKLAEVIKK